MTTLLPGNFSFLLVCIRNPPNVYSTDVFTSLHKSIFSGFQNDTTHLRRSPRKVPWVSVQLGVRLRNLMVRKTKHGGYSVQISVRKEGTYHCAADEGDTKSLLSLSDVFN